MSKKCPLTNEPVLYLDCLECEPEEKAKCQNGGKEQEKALEHLHLQIPGRDGFWVIDVNYDPDYPGIDVEYVSNEEQTAWKEKKSLAALSRPRVLFEEPNEASEKLRVLLWTDPQSEDYTEEVVFE